jgi:hypothetical protein
MTRHAVTRRALVLCIAVCAALPASAAAAEPRQQKATGPAALWKAFPLSPRPSRTILGSYRPGVLPTTAADDMKNPLIVTLLLMVIAASSAVLLRPARARAPIRRSTGRVRSTPAHKPRPAANRTAAGDLRAFEERRFGTCEIRLWRGHGTCQLHATTGRDDEAIAMSRSFRLQNADTPDPNALRVLSDLRGRLEAAGWAIASGRDWYQREPSGRIAESAQEPLGQPRAHGGLRSGISRRSET